MERSAVTDATGSEAFTLFADRARRVQLGFVLDEKTVATVGTLDR